MKSYKQFVAESNHARCNLDEGWGALGSGLRALGRSAGGQLVKRFPDIMSGVYGLQRMGQAVTNPAGYDEPGFYLGMGQIAPILGPGGRINPLSTAIKLGAGAVDAKRRIDSMMRRKKEEEAKNKNK